MFSKQTNLCKEHGIAKHVIFFILPFCDVVFCTFVVQIEAKSVRILLLGPGTRKDIFSCNQLRNFNDTKTELETSSDMTSKPVYSHYF